MRSSHHSSVMYQATRTSTSIRGSAGFTLIEVLVTTAILAIVFMGTSAATLGTIRGLAISDQQTTATTLARERLEQIMQADYDTVLATNYPLEDYGTLADHPSFRRDVTIEADTPETDMKRVTVTVGWHELNSDVRTVTLRTILVP